MHGSFMSAEAVARMKRMGILADVQPGRSIWRQSRRCCW
jgi:hypothetical protein